MSTEESKSKKWTKEEIERIVDERIKLRIHASSVKNKLNAKVCKSNNLELQNNFDSKEKEDNKKIQELEYKIEKSKNSIESLKNEFEKKEKSYKKDIEKLEKEISTYKNFFEELLKLYMKSCDILKNYNDTVLNKISLINPISFIISVSNEKNLSSYYDYIMYEYSNLDSNVILLFNELIETMCQMNREYSLIENNCQLDDNFHIEKNRKHDGLINKVLVKGYKYTVSEKTVRKSFVEV